MNTTELLAAQSLLLQQLNVERNDAINRAEQAEAALTICERRNLELNELNRARFAENKELWELHKALTDTIAIIKQAEDGSDLAHKYIDLAGIAGRLRDRAKAAEADLQNTQIKLQIARDQLNEMQKQRFDLAGHRPPFKYKGADDYFYFTEHAALHTFGIDEPGTAKWELVRDALCLEPGHFVFLSFDPEPIVFMFHTSNE